jgi:dihydrofolate reductase
MKAIIAVNNLGYIGKNDEMMWRSLEDFKHFKKMTMGGKLLVGYNTHLKLPPLPGREIFVAPQMDSMINHMKVCDWCIGGKKTYERFCKFFEELHISHIDNDDIGDTMFPDLREMSPDCKIFNYYFKTS